MTRSETLRCDSRSAPLCVGCRRAAAPSTLPIGRARVETRAPSNEGVGVIRLEVFTAAASLQREAYGRLQRDDNYTSAEAKKCYPGAVRRPRREVLCRMLDHGARVFQSAPISV